MLIDSKRCSNQFQRTSLAVFKLLAIAARFSSSWPRRKGRWSRMVRSGFIVPYDATTSPMRSRRPYGSGLCWDRGRRASFFFLLHAGFHLNPFWHHSRNFATERRRRRREGSNRVVEFSSEVSSSSSFFFFIRRFFFTLVLVGRRKLVSKARYLLILHPL